MNVKLIMIICLLLLPVAYADEGRTFELDFNVKEQYDLWLRKSDRILFEYGGYNNTFIIDEIKDQTVELDIFLFLERGLHTPDYQFLTKKYQLRLDFDKDGNKELSINLLNIDNKRNMANILFRRLDGWNPDAVLDLSEWKAADEKSSSNNYFRYTLFGAALTIILFISIFLWNRNRKRGVYF